MVIDIEESHGSPRRTCKAPLVASTVALAFCLTAAAEGFASDWAFDDGTLGGWMIQEGDWRVAGGALVHNDKHFKGGLAGRPGEVFGDVTVQADVRITEVFWNRLTVWAGILFGASSPVANGVWRDGYLLFVRVNGRVELIRLDGTCLGSRQTALDPQKEAVQLRIVVEGRRLCAYADGRLLIDVEDDRLVRGEVALVNYGNVATFDNVSISGKKVERRQADPVEPARPAPVRREPVKPLPRIGIRKVHGKPGEFFVRETGGPFAPKGFNHTVLAEGWHATFNVGTYDSEAMEATLSAMAALGANVIRVWGWGKQTESGFTAGPKARGLNGAYMDNFVDFLRRATANGIYVIPILDEVPHNAYYDYLAASDAGDWDVTGYNRQYLTAGPIAAKCAGAADFVRYVKEADEGLLSTVLGWSLANEVFVNHTEGPFYRDSGTVTTANGKTYDMADKDQRQACYDESIVHWANELAAAIKEVDPEALVTAGMWTSDAHGRKPRNGLIPDDNDPRRPPRPSVLAGPTSQLDFIDVHIYPWGGTPKVRREAHEWDAVMAGHIPAIVGEYGAFKRDSIDDARRVIREILRQARGMGYEGALFWVWDLTGAGHNAWSAVEEGLGQYVMELEADWGR